MTEQHGTGLLLIAMGITMKLLPADSKPHQRASASSANAKSSQHTSTAHEITQLENAGQDEEKNPLV